jgi:cell division protein FtsZ
VATGIDQEKMEVSKEPAVSQHRIAEAAQRLRAQATARVHAAAAAPPAPAPAPLPIVEAAPEPEYEQYVAPAEVELRPAAPRPAYYVEPAAQQMLFEEEQAEFMPPQPEQIVRPARMPQIEDLPPVVQRQMRIHRGEQPAPQTEVRRKSLLEKLAAFGITRQEEAAEPAPRAVPVLPAPPMRAAPPPQTHADYGHGRPQPRALAPRVAQGALDPHGRAGVKPASLEEDQLEIPAFLRRQSS